MLLQEPRIPDGPIPTVTIVEVRNPPTPELSMIDVAVGAFGAGAAAAGLPPTLEGATESFTPDGPVGPGESFEPEISVEPDGSFEPIESLEGPSAAP